MVARKYVKNVLSSAREAKNPKNKKNKNSGTSNQKSVKPPTSEAIWAAQSAGHLRPSMWQPQAHFQPLRRCHGCGHKTLGCHCCAKAVWLGCSERLSSLKFSLERASLKTPTNSQSRQQ